MARPIPRDPPVTRAALPSSRSSMADRLGIGPLRSGGERRATPDAAPSIGDGEPARGRDLALPAPARRQSRRLVPVGRRGVRARRARGPPDLPLDRLLGLPLVPRDGPRVLRGPTATAAVLNALVRQHQGRPRGAARRRRRLHGGGAGHHRLGRLADERVPHSRPAGPSSAAPTSLPVDRHGLPSLPHRCWPRSPTPGPTAGTRSRSRPTRSRRVIESRTSLPARWSACHSSASPARPAARRRTSSPRRSRISPPASTRSGAASPRPRSSPNPRWSICLLLDAVRDGETPRGPRRWPSAPSTRWPRAGSTTTSAAGSPATRRTPSGWSPTSRRCSTTRPACCAASSTDGRSPAAPTICEWSRGSSTTSAAT